jgi:formylglycine-generating enzyme required for sulfatase activity
VAINDLKRETRRALELTHPQIVRIHDFIDDGHTAAVSMEYVDGASLTQRRLAQPAEVFSATELQPWVEQLCEALYYAHTKAKIVHRDLKPANLMVDARGDLKVADFGISATLSETATRVSQQVGISGTPVYMSPQQMMGEKPAVSDDLYALGATLYELLTGKPPFYSGNILMQVQQKVPPSLAQRREDLGLTGLEPIPAAWEETIAACLAKEPDQRPASAREVRERLATSGEMREDREATVLVGGGDATVRVIEPACDDATARVTPTKEERDVTIAVAPDIDAVPPLLPVLPARSRRSPWPWAGALLGLVVLAGWYLGYHRPEQARQAEVARQAAESSEKARLEAELLHQRIATAEAAKQNAEEELAAVEAAKQKAELLRQRLAAVEAAKQKAEEELVAAKTDLEKMSGPKEGQAWIIPDLGLVLEPIPTGRFPMGSANGISDEKPVTQVKFTQPFWLGKMEVTQGEWEAMMGSNPSLFKNAGLRAPVENVSYDDVLAFCQKLTTRERAAGRLPEGYEYTLPTEAQWEYACRAGTTGDYAGSLDAMGWYDGGTTHAVGQNQANAWGLYDMHGNVWEWCLDWYGTYPGGTVTDPTGAPSGSNRVNRGGSWFNSPPSCRSASRGRNTPGYRNFSLGFRLALAPQVSR